MKVGIYGFPGSGKTSVFNVLSGHRASVGPSGKADVHLATIKVPDPRVDCLSAIFSPKKTTYAEVCFVDVPGGRRDTGAGLDPDQLRHLRDADAFAIVLRDFDHPFTGDAPDPLAELESIESELVITDLMSAEKRVERLKKEGKPTPELEVLERVVAHLNEERPLRELDLSEADAARIKGFTFVSQKPAIVLLNTSEDGLSRGHAALTASLDARRLPHFSLAAGVELEIMDLDPEERAEFFTDLGITGSSKDAFIQTAYFTLDLISFLTTGPDEVRAWPIVRGTTAVKAAGAIHSDIERGFIRAEISDYETYAAAEGDEAALRKAGKMRLEGKEYLMQDGDVVHYRFNV